MADPKVIVITGASSGIGAALAQHLGAGPPAGERARLALSARREPELRETARAAAVVVRYYGGVAAFERELAAQAGGR